MLEHLSACQRQAGMGRGQGNRTASDRNHAPRPGTLPAPVRSRCTSAASSRKRFSRIHLPALIPILAAVPQDGRPHTPTALPPTHPHPPATPQTSPASFFPEDRGLRTASLELVCLFTSGTPSFPSSVLCPLLPATIPTRATPPASGPSWTGRHQAGKRKPIEKLGEAGRIGRRTAIREIQPRSPTTDHGPKDSKDASGPPRERSEDSTQLESIEEAQS